MEEGPQPTRSGRPTPWAWLADLRPAWEVGCRRTGNTRQLAVLLPGKTLPARKACIRRPPQLRARRCRRAPGKPRASARAKRPRACRRPGRARSSAFGCCYARVGIVDRTPARTQTASRGGESGALRIGRGPGELEPTSSPLSRPRPGREANLLAQPAPTQLARELDALVSRLVGRMTVFASSRRAAPCPFLGGSSLTATRPVSGGQGQRHRRTGSGSLERHTFGYGCASACAHRRALLRTRPRV